MVRAVTVSEPRWLPGDVASLIASRRAEFAPRGPHGHLLSEATDPANQFKWRAHRKDDFAMRAIAYQQDIRRRQDRNADLSGDVWSVALDD